MAVVIFLAIAVSCMLVGKIFGVGQESKIIYKWKKTLEAVQYSYRVVVLTENDLLRTYIKEKSDVRNENILNLLKTTMNADKAAVPVPAKPIKNYKYRFLNGKKVAKASAYYVEKFNYVPSSPVIVGLNWFNDECNDPEEICGVVLFDMNGTKLPNRMGLDVFGANIYRDEIHPFGAEKSYQENRQNCQRLETGITCSQFYLMGGQFFK